MTDTRAPSARRRLTGWLDPRGRRLGGVAFILNRLTGLAVLAYLYLHLVVLTQLARGPEAWDAFVGFASSPVVLVFDVLLVAALVLHGLNGIRLSLVGAGLVEDQRALFIGVLVVGAIVLAIVVFWLLGVAT
jgi:succinate dehydrogenase / fumarate reductase cytochrome b subunit